MKLHWRVAEKLTGRASVFQTRSWPAAYADNKQRSIIARILCDDEYRPANVRSGNYRPLKIAVALKNEDREKNGAFTWRRLKGEHATLEAAKQAAQKFFDAHTDKFITEE